MNILPVQQLIWYASVSINLLPIAIGVWAWKGLTIPLRLIWATYCLSFMLAVSSVTIAWLGGSTHWLFYAGPIGYGVLFGLGYRMVIQSRSGKGIGLLTAVLPALLVALLVLVDGVKLLNLYAYALVDGLVVVLTLCWFNEQMRQSKYQSLSADPWFWISLSTLIYWGYSFIMSFFESMLFGYNEHLFNFFFFALSPFMQFLNVGLVCIGLWRVKMNNLTNANILAYRTADK